MSVICVGCYASPERTSSTAPVPTSALSQYAGLAANMNSRHIVSPAEDLVVVSSVVCDDAYGRAMERAILEANPSQVKKLLEQYGRSINDVIAYNVRCHLWAKEFA